MSIEFDTERMSPDVRAHYEENRAWIEKLSEHDRTMLYRVMMHLGSGKDRPARPRRRLKTRR